jgi:hypothetical protein
MALGFPDRGAEASYAIRVPCVVAGLIRVSVFGLLCSPEDAREVKPRRDDGTYGRDPLA